MFTIHSHTCTCYAIEAVLPELDHIFGNPALQLERVKCPASVVHMLTEQVLHKAVNKELQVLSAIIMGHCTSTVHP